MQPSSLPYPVWWVACVVVTVVFVAFFAPLIPGTRNKLRMCSMPLWTAAFCMVCTLIHWTPERAAHPMYFCAVLGVVLSCVGRRKVIRQAFAHQANRAMPSEIRISRGMGVQVALSATAMILLAVWVSTG